MTGIRNGPHHLAASPESTKREEVLVVPAIVNQPIYGGLRAAVSTLFTFCRSAPHVLARAARHRVLKVPKAANDVKFHNRRIHCRYYPCLLYHIVASAVQLDRVHTPSVPVKHRGRPIPPDRPPTLSDWAANPKWIDRVQPAGHSII